MNLFVLLPILLYLFAWIHMIGRVCSGGRTPDAHHGEYLLDPSCRMSDILSWATVVIGTTIVIPIAVI